MGSQTRVWLSERMVLRDQSTPGIQNIVNFRGTIRKSRPHSRSFLCASESNHPQCRYLLAKCCVDLNDLVKAEATLTGNVPFVQGQNIVEGICKVSVKLEIRRVLLPHSGSPFM